MSEHQTSAELFMLRNMIWLFHLSILPEIYFLLPFCQSFFNNHIRLIKTNDVDLGGEIDLHIKLYHLL